MENLETEEQNIILPKIDNGIDHMKNYKDKMLK